MVELWCKLLLAKDTSRHEAISNSLGIKPLALAYACVKGLVSL